MNAYPAVQDLRAKALKRIPAVAAAYLETGTDDEQGLIRNVEAFHKITFAPRFLKGELNPDIATRFLGRQYAAPFGIAPVGLTGLMWPGTERILARTASNQGIPYCLSTVATMTPESVSDVIGNMGWFQLYTPREESLTKKLLERARNAGFHTLVITVDIPEPSRRQRTKRAGMQLPPKISPGFLWDAIRHPAWTYAILRQGKPRLRTIEEYTEFKHMMSVAEFTQRRLGGNLSWDYVVRIREWWDGPVLLKGILHVDDAVRAKKEGFDSIVVSNHGARQFDAAPAALDVLPAIRQAVGDQYPLVFDSGVRSGLDVLRAIALGADFVLLGRAFLYGVAALGQLGGEHTAQIVMDELTNNMMQVGVQSVKEIKTLQPS